MLEICALKQKELPTRFAAFAILSHSTLKSPKQDAQDYFFVSRSFWTEEEWRATPAMVVGGVAADNWLVSRAVEEALAFPGDVLAVDATKTLTCVHQEHAPARDHGPRRASLGPRSTHNMRLARESGLSLKPGVVDALSGLGAGAWHYGRTSDLPYETLWKAETGKVQVMRRSPRRLERTAAKARGRGGVTALDVTDTTTGLWAVNIAVAWFARMLQLAAGGLVLLFASYSVCSDQCCKAFSQSLRFWGRRKPEHRV
jgi:hypothetical protein